MTDLKRQLDQVVKKELTRNIIPVKTEEGILVGNVLIVSEGCLKHLYKHGEMLYANISLNSAAVKMANLLAKHKTSFLADKIYAADQEYGKWFAGSQLKLQQYYTARKNKDFEKADTLWAKYSESKDRTRIAKNAVNGLTLF